MIYAAVFTRPALKWLQGQPKAVRTAVGGAIYGLQQNLRGEGVTQLEDLKFNGLPIHRLRVGEYRVAFSVKDDVLVIHVIAIGDRKDIYDKVREYI